ncbi:excinuclease ABC subunit UvrC [Candidatus Peregrinibacteria bacterium]|nr:excinuclease ABC subunit UvrC [Candidatus Peregrinibacteria bacterium]MBT7483926.1 excinuclease ABC subunit UvrC [Candidatus Peregrinibacteria bacterium]MBT7702639.1 excinuclease ABC subunit UvrC [Candidatus Peregrinibacteria bacterium]
MSSLKSIIAHVPHSPGVYRFLDQAGEVIYVGKAIDLKKRVSSYFRKQKNMSIRLQKLVENTKDIETTVVDSELEALILETNLIKSLRPKYNILMKDDKNYVYLKVTIKEDYPRVVITRRVEKDGAKYFGPKTSVSELKKILDVLKKAFPYRHCPLFIQFKDKTARDVKDHKKRCFGTCVHSVSKDEYQQAIDQIIQFFEGKTDEIEKNLKKAMVAAVQDKNFEKAALLRDRLQAIESILTTQRVSAPDQLSRDVIGLAVEGGAAYVVLFIFREGKLVNQENFVLKGVDFESGAELNDAEILESFLKQYYEKAASFPKEILIPEEFANSDLVGEWVSSLTDHKVAFVFPKKGKNKKVLDLAEENAKSFAKASQIKWQAGEGLDPEGSLNELKDVLKLKKIPRRMECYDISHLGGTETVGSMVVFEKGLPKKADYRHFKLRSVQEKIDDVKAISEVLERRLKYLKKSPDYLRKPKKKELQAIEKILKKANLDFEDLNQHKIIIAEKKKKIVGIGRLKPVDEQSSEIASLWVHEKHRKDGLGREIVEALIQKQRKGKLYALPCREKLIDWFGAMGFHELKDVPKIMQNKHRMCTEKSCSAQPLIIMVYRFTKDGLDASFSKKPGLLVIDGGKGQLAVVEKALKKAKLKIPLISLAKKEEEIFVTGQKKSIILPPDSGALLMLRRLRDEAHRFALKYQRNLRSKRMFK